MKRLILLVSISLLTGCTMSTVNTVREKPYYLGTDAAEMKDTCPGGDILKQYTCSDKDVNAMSCFDVYMVQGSLVNEQQYTLLQERVEQLAVSPEPACPTMAKADCASFLRALNYNLEFSWYLVAFPSSSFEQCRETYDCKRIDCLVPPDATKGETKSTLVSCVYKRNQLFFVGSDIVCQSATH